MKKYIVGYIRGQMSLKVLEPENVGSMVSELIAMGCDIQSADNTHIKAKFLKGSLPTGETANAILSKLLDSGWEFEARESSECSCGDQYEPNAEVAESAESV